ncbi:MAG: BatD family protein [Gammaproteobacteria bacterium]
MVIRLYKIITIFLMFTVMFSVHAADIKLTVDREVVSLSDSVSLFFQAVGSVDDDPDLSPLEKDFTILGKQQRSNLSIINGKRSSSKEWLVEVVAKREGELVIPVISFGKDQSPSAKVIVTNKPVATDQDKDDQEIFIEVEVSSQQARVQSQIIFTIKLFRATNTFNSSLSEAKINGGQVIVEKLEDRQFETSRNGKTYAVLQRRYALFPQASGKFTIDPIVFTGQISKRSRQLFDAFGRSGQNIKRFSRAIELDIKPVPADFSGETWLPAQKLEINEKWMKDNLELVAGEPVTRVIIIKAKGLTSEQLPEVNVNDLENFKIYPDQPELHNQTSRDGVLGIRQEKSAVIPNAAGEYVLPAIKLPWWNTQTGEMELAELPERVINVLPAESTSQVKEQVLVKEGLQDGVASVEESELEEPMAESSFARVDEVKNPLMSQGYWPWIAMLLGIGWLLTIIVWWMQSRSNVATLDEEKTSLNRLKNMEASPRSILRVLREAVRSNDPAATKDAVLKWAESIWEESTPKSLADLASLCEQPLSDQLMLLSSHIYGGDEKNWDGEQLLIAIENFDGAKQKSSSKDQIQLQSLHNI